MDVRPQHRGVPPLEGTRVLIVEDDFLIRIDLEFILREAGAEVVGACAHVKDALQAIADGAPTVAILDVRLGGETVSPVARELARRNVPFVFYTGQVDTDATLAEWPHCRVLSKPALPKAIVSTVAESSRRAC